MRLNSTDVFPDHPPFPKAATSEVKKMIRRLIRVMSHVFYRHIDDLRHAASTPKSMPTSTEIFLQSRMSNYLNPDSESTEEPRVTGTQTPHLSRLIQQYGGQAKGDSITPKSARLFVASPSTPPSLSSSSSPSLSSSPHSLPSSTSFSLPSSTSSSFSSSPSPPSPPTSQATSLSNQILSPKGNVESDSAKFAVTITMPDDPVLRSNGISVEIQKVISVTQMMTTEDLKKLFMEKVRGKEFDCQHLSTFYLGYERR